MNRPSSALPGQRLTEALQRIEGRGYKAYKSIAGVYDLGRFRLSIDHVQADPFAAPSRLSAEVKHSVAEIPAHFRSSRIRRVALADYLTRQFGAAANRLARGHRGTGKSGQIDICCGGQEILERNSVIVEDDLIEARFTVGLPAAGRRILARQAADMLLEELPAIVEASLFHSSLDATALERHVLTTEDQQALRDQLEERGLVAFVGDGSILPRRSGIDDRPMRPSADRAPVPFESPPSLAVELDRPNSGPIRGLGVPPGVTLITGGGFHGKSTLLRALERGVYNHVPGDGREWAVTHPSAVKIRAEDGRSVQKVDISPFINNLPLGQPTDEFSTENASGSTSQAANIIEALEAGSRLLLIDEDTSATNFMIRDARMQALIAKEQEPITPYIDRARELAGEPGVSSILVVGGAGDYLEIADQVLLMHHYRAQDARDRALQVVERYPSVRKGEAEFRLTPPPDRRPLPRSFDPRRGRRAVKISSRGRRTIVFGSTRIDLDAVEQLVDPAQTRSLGLAIHAFSESCAQRGATLREGLEDLGRRLDNSGLDWLSPIKVGDLARPRLLEVAAAINRMRTLHVQ